MYIERDLGRILQKALFSGKILVVYGPRQAGKTTLVKKLIEPYGEKARYIDCELLENKDLLLSRPSIELFSLIKNYKIVVFDEAQVIPEIGSILKTLFDHHPEVQYIATGSSSFDLINSVSEPLTGRSFEYTLYPLSIVELVKTTFDAEQKISEWMRFGFYPGVTGTEQEKIKILSTLTSQYLYKNVLSIGEIKKPELILKLLKLLALQLGQEVSYRELATKLETSQQTIERYVDLLEKNFIITKLSGYSKNMRNEVTRTKKIYFVDMGVRNVLIENFQAINVINRTDVGALFENLAIVERLKTIAHHDLQFINRYFWRTFSQQEVDYLEEHAGMLKAFEFKWNREQKTWAPPRSFTLAYPDAQFALVTPKDVLDFVREE
ncbi:hypothetical protein A3J23_00740 [Candidatus Peregrinibacteria bacterium RIFCSPLOWO2_02_FULL_48_14]|nr:MAG: hypothetical protein A3J23_00740 [Candidatus Peregrinibacteria bacterium RIFCSPLOWO2_02_FULL_48_14]